MLSRKKPGHARKVIRYPGITTKEYYRIFLRPAYHENRPPGSWRIHEGDLARFVDIPQDPPQVELLNRTKSVGSLTLAYPSPLGAPTLLLSTSLLRVRRL